MNDNNSKNSGLDGREIPFLVVLLGGAGLYKYGHAMQVWFHENLIAIVLSGIGLTVLAGYLILSRIQKKDKDSIDRMRVLQEAKAPSRRVDDYYTRKQNRDNR